MMAKEGNEYEDNNNMKAIQEGNLGRLEDDKVDIVQLNQMINEWPKMMDIVFTCKKAIECEKNANDGENKARLTEAWREIEILEKEIIRLNGKTKTKTKQ